ncbi:MAG: porin [Hyphomicrobiaceae bacterium]|nr:porin [Hyphomicrobiaceae bacterium]
MKAKCIGVALLLAASTAWTPAFAADLGGDCCADLEERVAELEATTARKGNRKVSLTVSGWVNEAVLFWDDGFETNTYQVTNMVAQTRFRLVGSAKISADWSAGYLIELGITGSRSDSATADLDDGSGGNAVGVRHSAWYLKSKTLGKVTVGQFSTATDGLLDAHVANIGHFMGENSPAMVGAFNLRTAGGGTGPQLRNMMGGNSTDSAQIGEGNRMNVVRYDSPALAGFTLSASWGEDDQWDVALRYAGEFSGFKLAANVGYQEWRDGNNSERNCFGPVAPKTRDQDCQQFGVFGGLLHAPTGLFVEGGYGIRWDDNAEPALLGEDDSSTQWFVIAGIEQKFFPIGKTTVFGGYQEWNVGSSPAGYAADVPFLNANLRAWSLGINQQIDAAAMDLYLLYRNYDGDSTNGAGVTTEYENFHQLMGGGRIQF